MGAELSGQIRADSPIELGGSLSGADDLSRAVRYRCLVSGECFFFGCLVLHVKKVENVVLVPVVLSVGLEKVACFDWD